MAEEPNNAHPAGASSPQPDAAMKPYSEQSAPPADQAGDQSAEGAGPHPQGDLEEQLADAQARAAEYHEAFLRARAEMDNVRRRAQEDVAKAHKFAVEGFAESLLPVVDSLEAALRVDHGSFEAMRSGVELTLRQLLAAFERNRLVPVDPAGQRFDPNLHQAISMAPSDTVPPQHVAATLQKGFTIADRVLRPALVTVSQGPQSGA